MLPNRDRKGALPRQRQASRSLAIAALLTSVVCLAQPVVLDTSTLLDGKGGTLKNQQIVIEGSRIRSIAPGKAAATYDLSGHFDSNHKLVNQSEPPQTSALYTAENAWLTLQGGFTTVQSVGAAIDAD